MKTPDKIYVPGDTDPIGFEAYQKKYPGDVEYIRKDTLLEWLKLSWAVCLPPVEGKDKPIYAASREAFQAVIDKIESI